MYIVGEEEIDALAKIIREGTLFRYGVGSECDRFEERYAKFLGVDHFALTVSGTFALSAAIIALGIGPGDEVLIPAHTYMATATVGADDRGDPGDRRCRREHHHRSQGGRGGHRAAHQGGHPGAYVGGGRRHERHHGDRRTPRPVGDRGCLPGSRRQLRGPQVRLDRACRRLQLQLLQEHDRGRGRRRLDLRREPRQTRPLRHRPLPFLLDRARGRSEAVRRQWRAGVRADGRDAQRPARPDRRHHRRDARREEADRRGHQAAQQSRPQAVADEQPRPRLRRPCHVSDALGRGGEALHRGVPLGDRRQDRPPYLYRVGPGADGDGRRPPRHEPLQSSRTMPPAGGTTARTCAPVRSTS